MIACAAALANWYAHDEDFALIAQYFIDAGADVNGATPRGDVALDFAIGFKEAGGDHEFCLPTSQINHLIQPSVFTRLNEL